MDADESVRRPEETGAAPETGTEPAGESGVVDTDFIYEKIKQRPLNRKKLARRTAITACMAVLFGAIACMVFLLLEPFFSNLMSPKSTVRTISFPEETQREEMKPEDMIADDSEFASSVANEAAQAAASAVAAQQAANSVDVSQVEALVRQILTERSTEISDYTRTYNLLKSIAGEAEKSVVVVTGITSDYDWFNDAYETSGRVSGVILADNGEKQLILCPLKAVKGTDRIRVTFCDGSQHTAEPVAEDSLCGLVVLGVKNAELSQETLSSIGACSLGSSAASDLSGTPVISIGAPNGQPGTISCGIITGNAPNPDITDTKLRLFTTDIYGSTASSGVLIDLGGKVVGITDTGYNPADMRNMLSAIGITELKPLIEKLSNGEKRSYFGVHGSDVTQAAHEEQDIPYGAYVRRTEMDSPAMEAGIQSGDIITMFAGTEINDYGGLCAAVLSASPGSAVRVKLLRMSMSGGYEEITVTATIGQI
ncbi:S1C family serine protease [Lachnoclostridium sp. Marseille-P6806]|uniref:S1C family serine protease n=1 Tax=Lachnoclostridium sp. Marseille-P6806 TaxID=2364793 RepID=UPI001031EDB4|nr:S1C family serine protease [Lachnoclostridium sp. Marseille-P6806]